MQKTPDELRQQARELRFAANHAERLSDARDELARAYELEAEADRLEGKAGAVVERPKPLTPEEIEARRRARLAEAMAKIEQHFGRPKQ